MLFGQHHAPHLSPLRAAINDAYRMDETICVEQRTKQATLPAALQPKIKKIAKKLVLQVRKERLSKSGLDAFLHEYDLSSEEGIALMCLAEALLRIPDEETVNQLIRDKITPVNWGAHIGEHESIFVNAATWGLMLTGKILSDKKQQQQSLVSALQKFLQRSSQPVIHQSVRQAMKILGSQFVMGRTIDEALKRAEKYHKKKGYLYSFDMLGEAARTAADAERYFEAYKNAIAELAKETKGKDVYASSGISVKLSALHPRYEFTQRERILPELTDRVLQLALLAKEANIGLTIDAEEADRLDLSLDIIERVFTDKKLGDWEGFGLAVQAYQKRAYPLLDWLIDLARKQKKRLNVRLVKGAYWDYEIKDSQVKGLDGYPVFTRKPSTDVSYIACVKKMLAAKNVIYSQFGTHNAHTVGVILALAGKNRDFEFQALHGMGYALYDELVEQENVRCRIYAPVGTHEDLLAYLVRRLLENGANTSFVNRIVDDKTPVSDLLIDPIAIVKKIKHKPHSMIPLPADIYGKTRRNSRGLDLSNYVVQAELDKQMSAAAEKKWQAVSLIGKKIKKGEAKSVTNPTNRTQIVGEVYAADVSDVETALQRAQKAAWRWDQTPIEKRAEILEKAGDLFQQHMPELMMLAIREAGKNIFDSLGEVREAVDYCRYYAEQARSELAPKNMPGPTGETNQLQMHGRGIAACISPWNFPLAIFIGQVTAALASGNAVIAKPAKQTPLIAMRAVELLHEAGIPDDVLQLVYGPAQVIGNALTKDERVKAVILTGSTNTARLINQNLANREGAISTLIAETGGQNAMIVDSTALPEQVTADVIASAFNSAGQRCSALRVLYVQEEVADKIITMIKGAMQEVQVDDPSLLQTDIGPVIDEDARQNLLKHVEYLKEQNAKLIYQMKLPSFADEGCYFAPCAFEIPSIKMLKHEVFGPVLHIIRFRGDQLDQVIDDINSTGYGLTQGIHTRINERVNYIQSRIRVGNTYVNRNIIGAVVGVQPFGGENLSGTGPKAGGPHYLPRLCVERTLTINTTAAGGNTTLMTLDESR